MALYDHIGQTYDITRRADAYILERLLHHLDTKPEGIYLDVACGTGSYTSALAQRGLTLHGIDQSSQMLEEARKKHDLVKWHLGEVESLPFSDGCFSGALCTLAIHHFATLLPVFKDVFRVLNQGRFVIFTAEPDQIRRYWLKEYFPDALGKSITQMPDLANVQSNLEQAGFVNAQTEPYEIQDDLQDFFLYSGKHQPQMYLDPHVRSGISTFSSLADPREVERGLKQLSADLQSGRIQRVIESYQHDGGDYLFVIAEKKKIC